MPLDRQDEFRLAVTLATAAGFADAISYLASGVFAANMTGNTVLTAMSLAQGDWNEAVERGLTIVAFFAGALAGALAFKVGRRQAAPILIEAVLILVAAALERRGDIAVLVIAGAMGAQASALTRIGQASISTVVVTTALMRLASFCVTAAADRERIGMEAAQTAPLAQFAAWACYGVGAVVAVLALHVAARPLFAPAVLLALLGLAVGLRERRPRLPR